MTVRQLFRQQRHILWEQQGEDVGRLFRLAEDVCCYARGGDVQHRLMFKGLSLGLTLYHRETPTFRDLQRDWQRLLYGPAPEAEKVRAIRRLLQRAICE